MVRKKPSSWIEELPGRLQGFVNQWRNFQGTEQAGAQQYLQGLLDIYDVSFQPGTVFEQHPVKVPAPEKPRKKSSQQALFPGEVDVQYTTERMDMYLPKICVWEMKAPAEKDLQKHHEQLLRYWARMRTRYLVLCNFHEFWVYDTNDEHGQLTPKVRFSLVDLPANGDALLFLRGDFQLELLQRSERITSDVAARMGRVVRKLIETSPDPKRDRDRVAKLVLECVFAMFAEDAELIPPKMFTNAVREADRSGKMDAVYALFDDFGRAESYDKSNPTAPYVNGPLFDRNHPKMAVAPELIHELYCAAKDFDWQDVRPEIFGSIFEQAIDPVRRHELGAHFTRETDIERIVMPTVIEPWRQRIAAVRTPKDAQRVVEQMRSFHVLDPACGCGNFLYVVYREMKRLESAVAQAWTQAYRNVAKRRADIAPPPPLPYFTLDQIHGIELDPFACFLARVVLWIGEHMAKRELALEERTLPLKNLDNQVLHADALLVDWPRPDGELAIVGNPPYLGVRKLRGELGDEYVEQLFARYPDNRAADYVTYWFTRAVDVLRPGERAGFVATNSIAQNESREASIDRIVERGGTLTSAWRSYPWPGEAAVHIAIVNWIMDAFDGIKELEGQEVSRISPNLTDAQDVTGARPIPRNMGLCFMGVTLGNNGFVLDDAEREAIIAADPKSAEVIRPYLIGRDVNREIDEKPSRWVIDFGMMDLEESEQYAGAIRHVRKQVYPVRRNDRRESRAKRWWRFAEPAPNLRKAAAGIPALLVMPRVSPHLIVSRQSSRVCFDGQLMVVALCSNYHFAVLQSRYHVAWAWARCSTLKGDLRYTNTTAFETFPFPSFPDGHYAPRVMPTYDAAVAAEGAGLEFNKLRGALCKKHQLGLTKIHNMLEAGDLPELTASYEKLNDAVTRAYGFPEGTWRDDKAILGLLLQRNLEVARLPAGAI